TTASPIPCLLGKVHSKEILDEIQPPPPYAMIKKHPGSCPENIAGGNCWDLNNGFWHVWNATGTALWNLGAGKSGYGATLPWSEMKTVPFRSEERRVGKEGS